MTFLTVAVLLLSGGSCDGKTENNQADPVVDRKTEEAPLDLERAAAYDSNRQKLEMEQLQELDAVDGRLKELFSMIDERDLSGLPDMIHPSEGVHIDLKAHRTRKEVRAELQKSEGYFQRFYLDSQLLRQTTGDDGQISLHELLNKNERIFTEYYLEPGGSQIEVRFRLGSTPEESYRINNAVLIKRDGQWYFLQLL